MKKMSNTAAIMIVAIGLFVIVFAFAIIVRLYEIGGTKKAPLFAGELEEKIDFLNSNNLREYISRVGIEYGASTYLRNLSCEIGPYFRVEKLEFSIDSLISRDNMRLFRYDRAEGKTVIENIPQNSVVIKAGEGVQVGEVNETESEEGMGETVEESKKVTVEQFGDALRFYLRAQGREGPENLLSIELKVFQTKEELLSFVEESGAHIYIRKDGQYQLLTDEEAGSVFLYETAVDEKELSTGKLYELEYY